MKQTINFSQFCDSFSDTYKNNFTYEGKKALFEYLEELEEETGEEIEMDTIALCCEYTEYESLLDCLSEYNYDGDTKQWDILDGQKEKALEWLRDRTQVIEMDNGGVIIQQF